MLYVVISPARGGRGRFSGPVPTPPGTGTGGHAWGQFGRDSLGGRRVYDPITARDHRRRLADNVYWLPAYGRAQDVAQFLERCAIFSYRKISRFNYTQPPPPSLTSIKYSLDFLRPIITAEAFEVVDWLAYLPQQTWP